MSKRHISLKDLAQELGVSISTVSRALKNHPDISPEMTKKVQLLAEKTPVLILVCSCTNYLNPL